MRKLVDVVYCLMLFDIYFVGHEELLDIMDVIECDIRMLNYMKYQTAVVPRVNGRC